MVVGDSFAHPSCVLRPGSDSRSGGSIPRLASDLIGVPVALVSLVHEGDLRELLGFGDLDRPETLERSVDEEDLDRDVRLDVRL